MNIEDIEKLQRFANELRELQSHLMGTTVPLAHVGGAMRDLADRMELAATRALWAQSQDDSRKF